MDVLCKPQNGNVFEQVMNSMATHIKDSIPCIGIETVQECNKIMTKCNIIRNSSDIV